MSGHGETSSGGGGGGAHGGGHKKKHHGHHKHEEHEHEEGWIVGFADNVLLQMGFFVILLAMNMGPKGGGAEGAEGASQGQTQANTRMVDFAIAVREAFNSPVDMNSTDPNDLPLIRRLRERMNIGDTTAPGADGDQRQVQTVRPNDWAGKDAYVDFRDNSSDLTDAARTIIKQASEQIAGTYWIVEIRGHASKVESFRDEEKSRRLSYDRAWAVAKELEQHGVRWEQMLIVAAGDISPVKPMAATQRDHEANQRVEILITRTTMPSDPYSGGAEKK